MSLADQIVNTGPAPAGETFTVHCTPEEINELREELQAHRDGIGHLAEDMPGSCPQPIHETRNETDEPSYWRQVTHQGMPLWSCQVCSKLTLTTGAEPAKCAGCGAVDTCGPLLYPESVVCRSWLNNRRGQLAPVDGPCLIAGSDGCECPEAAAQMRCEGLDPGDWPEADCGNQTPHPAHPMKVKP